MMPRLSWMAMGVGVCLLPMGFAWAGDPVPGPMSLDEEPLTLRDCYQLSLKRSEELAIKQQVLEATQGRFLQALSGALPRASFEASQKRQNGSGNSSFTLKHVPERRFIFSQPLFAGFKEFAAMAGSRAERRQRLHEKTRAEQLLMVDVSDAFYLVLEKREDLSTLEMTRTALVQRVDELVDRERLGRSRKSEVASVEAQLRRVEADWEQSKSQEQVARELLEFLTGLNQVDALNDDEPLPAVLDAEDAYMAKAAVRPDVKATEAAWRVAKDAVWIAQAQLWPTVNADADYYTKRVGSAADVDWDATLTVDVPLFQGGQAVGKIRETRAQAREAKLQFEKTQREAALDIQEVYTQLQAALTRQTVLERAFTAAEESYQLQVDDYRKSLVSTLDVLQTLQTLQDVRRDFVRAKYDTKRQYWLLRAATGDGL